MLFDTMPQIKSESVMLREFAIRDAEMVQTVASDSLIPLITTVPGSGNWEDAVKFIERQHDRFTKRVGYSFAVADVQTDEAVGQIGLWCRDIDHGRVSTGYWIAPRFRGRGYASAALTALCRWAFEQVEIARIELYVEPWNEASWTVAERCGFQREGILRSWQVVGDDRKDMYMYSLIAPIRESTKNQRPGSLN